MPKVRIETVGELREMLGFVDPEMTLGVLVNNVAADCDYFVSTMPTIDGRASFILSPDIYRDQIDSLYSYHRHKTEECFDEEDCDQDAFADSWEASDELG